MVYPTLPVSLLPPRMAGGYPWFRIAVPAWRFAAITPEPVAQKTTPCLSKDELMALFSPDLTPGKGPVLTEAERAAQYQAARLRAALYGNIPG